MKKFYKMNDESLNVKKYWLTIFTNNFILNILFAI